MDKARIYFSLRSPYSRLGLHIVQRNALPATLIAFTGPPDGAAFQDPTMNKPKLAYYGLDAPRMTMRMGLTIARPSPFDVDFTPAIRAFYAADARDRGLDFAIAASDARWGRGENVSDMAVLEACAKDIGLDPSIVADAQNDPAVDKALEAGRAAIEEDQAFGVPFAVFRASKYWGHDRFDLLVEDMAAAR
ncbi:MAG: DsbA family protein [Pseudomonadota bacterium]